MIKPKSEFRFEVQIEGVTAGWFAECSGLTIEREVFSYQEGGVNDYIHQLPGQIKHQSLTLKHGIADDRLWQWLQKGVYDGKVKRCHVSVILYNTDRSEAKRWDLTNVYPTKWSGSQLKTGSQQVAIESLELSQNEGSSNGGAVQRVVNAVSNEAATQELQPNAEIDIHLLANRVYALLKQELRVEQDRSGRHRW